MNTALQAFDIVCAYEDRRVLDRVSFDVRKGEFFIIIGPNGSGKTTLLKSLCGMQPTAAGRIEIQGRPLKRMTRKQTAVEIAMVPQFSGLDFPFTVEQVVLMGRSPHQGILGLADESDRRIAKDAMTFTGTRELARRRIHELSGGEAQRVSIARALCQQPRIMLLDEPTASLDLAHQVRVMDLMERLKKDQGVTVVMVSHDINLAAMYADRLLLLKNGAVVRTGPPAEVIDYRILEETYGCKLLVDENPLGRTPRITLVPGKHLKKN
jgi:iron complex transport system ATP-binding protein